LIVEKDDYTLLKRKGRKGNTRYETRCCVKNDTNPGGGSTEGGGRSPEKRREKEPRSRKELLAPEGLPRQKKKKRGSAANATLGGHVTYRGGGGDQKKRSREPYLKKGLALRVHFGGILNSPGEKEVFHSARLRQPPPRKKKASR